MGKAASEVPAAKLALYEKLVATQLEVERRGVTMPYTSCNGHMFSFLDKSGKLALRLPAAARDEFLRKFKTKLAVSHGTVMKEYVAVPDALLRHTQELKAYFAMSYDYVCSLAPKPTTRKKKSPAKKKTATKKKAAAKKKRGS